jgi:hypothetical protein
VAGGEGRGLVEMPISEYLVLCNCQPTLLIPNAEFSLHPLFRNNKLQTSNKTINNKPQTRSPVFPLFLGPSLVYHTTGL